uniref:Uncharacterized protein n=1 Tax=Anguilla anguilla TaxID=7936 RepID=A0A0E9TBZ0_ANGAN
MTIPKHFHSNSSQGRHTVQKVEITATIKANHLHHS